MKFRISSKIFQDYPELFIGVVTVKGADNHGDSKEAGGLLREAEAQLKEQVSQEGVTLHPHIIPWRDAYQKFGSKPRDFRCSSEALTRLVLKGVQIRHINKVVDLYNYVSIKYVLTVGGEDLDTIKGDLVLDYAVGDERFIPLGTQENDQPIFGEVIYKDDVGAICRRWNWREGDRTKLTEDTKNAVLVIEGLPPIKKEVVKQATNELADLTEKYCGGKVAVAFLEKDQEEITLV